MVLGLLALTAIPTTIATTQGIKAQRDQEREQKRSQDCSLTIFCDADSFKAREIHNKAVVVHSNKVWVSTGQPNEYEFSGFYIPFPNDQKPLGLVTMTSDDPPAMGWIYVDKVTRELKYGNRTTSLPQLVGPWDWTEDEVGVTLEDREAFVAVEEAKGIWALYYDREDDESLLPGGKTVLQVSVERHLKPAPKGS